MKTRVAMLGPFILLVAVAAWPASTPIVSQSTPIDFQKAETFDAEAATRAYLDTLPPDKKARSDAYFEGGYWLQLWTFLWSSAVMLLFLHSGLSARLRDLAARVPAGWLTPAVYWVPFLAIGQSLSFPLTFYARFLREHRYGLATQTFGAWMGDQAKGLAVDFVLGAILMTALYAVLRRVRRTWWLWGSGVAVAFLVFTIVIGPVYIQPLFNTYRPLQPGPLRDSILRMAHANGIGADEVYEVDASRQTTRISANVAGLFGTERIALNDNLLARASPAGVEAVLAHEIGHYVLNHVFELVFSLAIVILIGFAFLGWSVEHVIRRWGPRWRVTGVADPAGLPLLALLLGVYLFLLTPVMNTIIRANEYEADVFGLNAARQPDGFAEVALLLSEYRKLEPDPLEEWFFYDHPSGRTRILTAMRWKAAVAAPAPR